MKMTVVVFMFKIDFKNAFNTIHRDKLLDLVREVLPNYHSFVWQCYRFPSRLIYGQHILASARGIQQGDPLNPMPFCLAIEALTNKLTSPFNLGYLDDGTIGRDCSKVLADLYTVISEGIRIGLQLNPSKCELSLQGGTAGKVYGGHSAWCVPESSPCLARNTPSSELRYYKKPRSLPLKRREISCLY
ncbi:hypothetical protein RvY_11283 [Ramazzottius varieornatus]|uniref:Reverse transcriptase domain-containing protein n=1 Tax=Ramazzottius varieornatus TaxID=947166 RepID=A0A1D1VI13_RAMVA|nr:hypothetical protein RvY_11283 [Ramazzottius varieornatus]